MGLVSAAVITPAKDHRAQAIDGLELAFKLPHFANSRWYPEVIRPYLGQEISLGDPKLIRGDAVYQLHVTMEQAAVSVLESMA